MKDIQELIQFGHLDQALEKIDKLNSKRYLEAIIYKSRIYYHLGNFHKSYQYAVEAIQLANQEGRKQEEFLALIELAYAHFGLNQFDLCISTLDNLELQLNDYSYPPSRYRLIKEIEAKLYNIRGLVSRYQGDLNQALTFYTKSQGIRSKLGQLFDFAGSLNNIGTIFQMKGDLQQALQYHLQSKEIFKQFDNNYMLSYVLHDIGGVYWELNEFEKSRGYYDQCLSIRINLSHHQNTAKTLLNLIQLHIEFDYLDLSRYYFDMIEEIHKSHQHPMIDIYYKLGEVSILKTSPRLIKRAQAQQILNELQHEQLPYEYEVMVKLNLCQLYLIDLKLSRDNDILNQVDDIIQDLAGLSKKQHSPILLIETLLLQSKLALIRLDLDTAQALLFQAEIYANQNNLNHLAYKVSSEHDMIVDKIYKWETLQKRNVSLIERLEEVKFNENLDFLSSKRSSWEIKPEVEDPLFLLILNQNSITLYSRLFKDDVNINEELIGSYLLASDKGIASALNNDGSIERIKYGEYQLIFVHSGHLVFCYGFQGESYFAIRRINDFIDHIKLSRSWSLLRASTPKPKEIEQSIETKIVDYFTPEGVYSRQSIEI